MAWRDSRRDRKRLLLFSSSIIFGIAALVSIGSLKNNLQEAIDEQGKSLLGADMMISARRAFPPEVEAKLDELEARRAEEISFTTMLLFSKSGGTRLVQVRGLQPAFPFYGKPVTAPPGAWNDCLAGEGVLMEESLMEQFGAVLGDRVKIGDLELPVLGRLVKTPPRASAFSAFAPQVYVAYHRIAETGLLGEKSLAFYRSYFAFPEGANVDDAILEPMKPMLRLHGVSYETVERRKRNLGRALDNLYSFLSLIGFIALLLGGIGIASAIHVHVLRRIDTVATLRCLGCPSSKAFGIYLIQGICLGGFGALLGTGLGVLIQQGAPAFFKDQLPFEVDLALSPQAILTSVGIGFLLCVSFALLPLLQVRRVSPLAALRSDVAVNPENRFYRDRCFWGVILTLTLALVLVGFSLSPRRMPMLGVTFVAGVAAVLGLLAGVAHLIRSVTRKLIRPTLPFALRQGFANLYRPRNQTLLFLTSIGLGAFLMMTLFVTERLVVSQLAIGSIQGKPNIFMIDVQPHQREGVTNIVRELGLEVETAAPLVSMRLSGINGKTVEELQENEETEIPRWILRRDFRSTYRDHLTENEELIKGEWVPRVEDPDFDKLVPVSIEEGIARDMKVGVGDEISMDVQGLPLTLEITSIRDVDWESMDLNFFLVFPEGILEQAPGFFVLTTRVDDDAATSGALQNKVVQAYPNVTVVDITLIIETIESIIEKIAYVMRFMALFTVLAGGMILVGAILSGKRDRIEESVLLRTLGASRKQILHILLTEYFLLGLFAALTGAVLAFVASWALARFVFEVNFFAYTAPLWVISAVVCGLSVAFGLMLSRGITRHPPLTILRHEH